MNGDQPLYEQHWFLLLIRYKNEKAVAGRLHQKGYEIFLPTYESSRQRSGRVKHRALLLFSCYLFSRFSLKDQLAIESTSGVLRIFKASQKPYIIPDAEVDSLRTMLGSGYAVKTASHPQPGDIVRVGLNPNQDLQGIVLRAGEMYRIFVSINALLQCFYIEVPRSVVTFKDDQQ